MQYQKVFQRDEKKYLLTPKQYKDLLAEAGDRLRPDQYPESTTCSLYYDTRNYDLIIRSIEKPLYKQKIRLRSYNVPKINDEIFLESKIKFRGLVGKRRIKIRLSDFYFYYNNIRGNPDGGISLDNTQIGKELDWLFRFYQLQPAWLIAYDRKSYRASDESDLRITFDHNLRSRTTNLELELGDDGEKYFSQDEVIMEIKSLHAMPIWLTKILSNLEIRPVSFTKYGKIYEKHKSLYDGTKRQS